MVIFQSMIYMNTFIILRCSESIEVLENFDYTKETRQQLG